MNAGDVPDRFTSWPPGIEPEVPIIGYPNTWTHTPVLPAIYARSADPRSGSADRALL